MHVSIMCTNACELKSYRHNASCQHVAVAVCSWQHACTLPKCMTPVLHRLEDVWEEFKEQVDSMEQQQNTAESTRIEV